MPKLEYLEVDSNTQSCENFFKSVSKCRRLKYLNVDYLVYDPDLEPLPRSCPELRFLHLFSSDGVTGEGLQAVSALPLEEVTLDGRRYQLEITDDEVVDFARSCPSLEVLKVNAAFELTVGVVARAAVARRESGALGPLRLNLVGTHIQEQQDALGSYEELILDFSDE